MLSIRPRVAELAFQLYTRPLHPELFEAFQTRTVERGGYTLKMDITNCGHVLTWRHEGLTLTEVCTSAHQSLPTKRRIMAYQIKGRRSDQFECHGGIRYHTTFQLEAVSTKLFRMCQRELCNDERKVGLVHEFDSSGRMTMGAVSYMNAETRNRSVFIQAFHTFPDDNAIVKTETYFRLPG
ncbi:DUF2617 family protein [Bremerella sp. JC817]|uniref:DUF2617 family protein n=1 Tax=Bremerella sp. JC817 TaxID=3231756 RepID=UPI003458C2AA